MDHACHSEQPAVDAVQSKGQHGRRCPRGQPRYSRLPRCVAQAPVCPDLVRNLSRREDHQHVPLPQPAQRLPERPRVGLHGPPAGEDVEEEAALAHLRDARQQRVPQQAHVVANPADHGFGREAVQGAVRVIGNDEQGARAWNAVGGIGRGLDLDVEDLQGAAPEGRAGVACRKPALAVERVQRAEPCHPLGAAGEEPLAARQSSPPRVDVE